MKKMIILHGWATSTDKWHNFIEILREKSIPFELLKIPGLTEPIDKPWAIDNYVDWLKKIVDKEKDRVVLVGHSNGGRIALAFTNLYPERVEKLILIDSAGIYHNELPLKIKRVVFKTLAKIGKIITPSNFLKNLLYKLARESDYKDLDENTKQTMVNLISADLKPILSHIRTSTLIIWGREDKITPLSDGILMNNLIKNSKLEIINAARHSPQFTHPEEVTKSIQQFNNRAI